MQPNNFGGQQYPQVPQPGPQMQPGQVPYPQQPPTSPANKPKGHSHLVWIIAVTLLSLLLLSAAGFGYWAFSERSKYKNETDAIVEKEVAIAVESNETAMEADFVEREKYPNQTYQGPSQFGSVNVLYPKTWSAFVTEKDKGPKPIEGYFHPDFVPGIDSGTLFALRVEVSDKSYDAELKSYDSKVKSGKITVSPFRAEKVPDVLGSRLEGEIDKSQHTIMVMFPIRDKTLRISTESEQFFKDFNDIVLPNLVFVP